MRKACTWWLQGSTKASTCCPKRCPGWSQVCQPEDRVQVHRIAHHLWNTDQRLLARMLQSRISEVFSVDIHPAARLGAGLLLDHASGVVIGETAVVGNNVSIMQGVTLGGAVLLLSVALANGYKACC